MTCNSDLRDDAKEARFRRNVAEQCRQQMDLSNGHFQSEAQIGKMYSRKRELHPSSVVHLDYGRSFECLCVGLEYIGVGKILTLNSHSADWNCFFNFRFIY